MATEILYNALLRAFERDTPSDSTNEEQARSLTEILAACATLFVPPAADDTQALILAELRGLRAELAADRTERQALGVKVFQTV